MKTSRYLVLGAVILAATMAGAQTTHQDTDSAEFEASLGSPYTINFDTGWLPSGSALKLKAFFYASAGEAHAKYAGTFTASWDSASAIPGNNVTVTLSAAGNPDESTWESDAGLRYGVRYKFKASAGGVSYKKEDYVPRLPNLDLSFPCPADTFMSFGLGQLLSECSAEFGAGGNCLLTIGDYFGSCYASESFQLNPDYDWFCDIDVSESPRVDEDEQNAGEVEIELRPVPPVAFSAGAAFGICLDMQIGSDNISHSGTGQTIYSPSGTMSFQVAIPCDLANRTQGSVREHHFDIDGVQLDANAEVVLVGRINPTFAACVAELVELSIAPNVGLCFTIPLSVALPEFDFPDADLNYTIPIADPEVRNIRPDSTITTNFIDPVTVGWETSWDTPSNVCGLQVKGYYRFTDVINDPWKEINSNQPVDNTGEAEWDLSGQVFAACRTAQLRIDLLDPRGKFLATANGDPFLIDVEPPVVLAQQPPAHDYVCAGDTKLIQWSLPPASCGSLNPASISLWLQLSTGQIVPIVYGLPGTMTQHLWQAPKDFRTDANARIVIQARDDAGNVGQDVIEPFGYNQPAAVNVNPGGDPAGFFPVPGGPNPFGADVEENSLPGTFGACPNGGYQVDFGYFPEEGSPPGVEFETGPGLTLPGVYEVDLTEVGQVIPFQFSVVVVDIPPDAMAAPRTKAVQIDTFRATVRSTTGPPSEYTDEMLIHVDQATGTGDLPRATRDRLVAAIPNPFNPQTRLIFELVGPRPVSVGVYDLAGRKVRTLLDRESRPAGRGEAVWYGRDDAGRAVASGAYYVKLDTGQGRDGMMITLVR